MDQTPIYGFPYPECDPPLTQDASDITQMRNLALAIDAAVEALNIKANDELIVPDLCRMQMSAAVATTETEVTPFFNTLNFQTLGSGMADTTNGGVRIQENGWYYVGGYTHISATIPAATQLALRTAIWRNGLLASNFHDSARIFTGDEQHSAADDTLLLNAGDLIQLRHRSGATAGTSWTYQSRIWVLQLLAT